MSESQDTQIIFSQYAQDPYDISDSEINNPMFTTQTKKKSTRCKGLSSSSYVITKNKTKGRKVIKIQIYEENEESERSDQPILTAVQYIVQEPRDEIMDLTEHIINKISKKLVGCNW